jgi:type I restriction enzyme S subunit
MQSREFGDQADAVKGSTDMADYVSLTNQRRMLVTLPAIEDQRRVAAILGAIDDLMEISRRRIALHDEVLRMVYREWFVERRFPGHEAIENADAAGAPLPAGWRVAELGTLADLNAQKVRAADAPPSIDYVDISSVSPGEVKRTDRVRFEDAPGRARRRVAHGDTIWSSVRPNRRSFAVVLNPSDDLIVSTGFTVITPRDLPWTYEYFAVTSDPFVDFLVGHATGAAYPAVTATDFALAPVVVPKADLLERFHRFAEPAMLLVDGLRRANATLRSTRDLLLPRLVGGPVDTARVSGPTQHPAT